MIFTTIMTHQQLLQKIRGTEVQKIGKTPVVVLPLRVWEEIEDYLENLAMEQSHSLKKRIAHARFEQKMYSSSQVKKMVGC